MRLLAERALTSPLALRVTWLAATTTGRWSSRWSQPFVLRLWFTPWRLPTSHRAAAREESWLADTDSLEVPWQDRTLRGFVTGDGPTVLLWGLPFDRPVSVFSEYLDIVTSLIRSGAVNHEGEHYRVNTMFMRFQPVPDLQVILAALGPRMLSLAGSRADGTVT